MEVELCWRKETLKQKSSRIVGKVGDRVRVHHLTSLVAQFHTQLLTPIALTSIHVSPTACAYPSVFERRQRSSHVVVQQCRAKLWNRREQAVEACFEDLVLHEVIRVLASMLKDHHAETLIGFQSGFVHTWDEFEE